MAKSQKLMKFFMFFGPVFDRFWTQNGLGPKPNPSDVGGKNGPIWENFPFFYILRFFDPFKNSVFL
jgi:hypothetical protein